jgi:hypothetical protein
LKVKGVIWTESLATVGCSWLAAELPAERARAINADEKSVKAEVNRVLFLKAHLLNFPTVSFSSAARDEGEQVRSGLPGRKYY